MYYYSVFFVRLLPLILCQVTLAKETQDSYKEGYPPRVISSQAKFLEQTENIPPLLVDPLIYDEPWSTGWQLYVDNDLFINPDTDRDYTGGFSVSFSGLRARNWRFSIDTLLDKVDRWLDIDSLHFAKGGFSRHTLQFGVILFTPDDITQLNPVLGDHPYASLLFMSNSQKTTFPERRLVIQSALTIGILGLDIGPEIQRLIHNITGSDDPLGWHNQISDGGEMTARYSLIAQKNIMQNYSKQSSFELSTGVEGNIGLNTDVSGNLGFRYGKLRSPWWSFTPHQSDYINLGQTITSRVNKRALPPELFIWGGLKSKYRIYNGLLQGQFRDNMLEYKNDELKHIIWEAWLGITKTWRSGFGLSFVIRKRANEIKGLGRDPLWSGLIFSFKT